MQNQVMNDWLELNKKSLGLARHWGDIQLDMLNKLARRQNDMLGVYLDGGVKQIELAGSGKPLTEIWSAEAELAEQIAREWLDNTMMTVETLNNSANQLHGWMEKSFEMTRGNAAQP